jgi:hypothetical protein
VPPAVPRLTLPAAYLVEWRVLPLVEDGRVRVLAAATPDPQTLDDLRWLYGVEPVVETVSAEELDTLLTRLEHGDGEGAADLFTTLEDGAASTTEGAGEADLAAHIQEAPVIRLHVQLRRGREPDAQVEGSRRGGTAGVEQPGADGHGVEVPEGDGPLRL